LKEEMIRERIRQFLVQQFPATKNVGSEDLLLKNGLIDSLGILEVVTFFENEFGIVLSDEELLPENFGSLSSLSNFVWQKTNGAS
jgi:acyl carrier protein